MEQTEKTIELLLLVFATICVVYAINTSGIYWGYTVMIAFPILAIYYFIQELFFRKVVRWRVYET